MALFKNTITRVTGRGTHLFDGVGEKMLNSSAIIGLTADGTGSSYEYVMNLEDDREGIVRIETAASVSSIIGVIAAADISTFVTLSVYPSQDTAATTISTSFLTANISLGYEFDGGSILYIRTGTALQRVLVSDTIDEILEGGGAITDTVEWTDGTDLFRVQVRSNAMFLDEVILGSVLGFNGVEDTDWSTIKSWE